MELYTLLRAFADSWFLLFMTLFYLGCIVFAFRPGAKNVHSEISQIPLREDDWIQPRAHSEPKRVCARSCAGCPCAKDEAQP